MEKKKLNSPFVGVDLPKSTVVFDTTYKSIKIVDTVKKTGEGENDFIIEKKVIVEETPIKDVVEADRESVGVENIIRQVLRSGDTSLLPIDHGSGELVDLVGAPENLMELKQVGVNAENAFKSLPKELVDGMDMVSFVNSMSQDKFDAFVKAVNDRAAGKTESEVKKDE